MSIGMTSSATPSQVRTYESNQATEQATGSSPTPTGDGPFDSDRLGTTHQRLRVAHDGTCWRHCIPIDDEEAANVLHPLLKVFVSRISSNTLDFKTIIKIEATSRSNTRIFTSSHQARRPEGVWKSSVLDVKEVLIKIGNELVAEYCNHVGQRQSAYPSRFAARTKTNSARPIATSTFI